jgi:GH25 family lysozyme M1 (1,4-beta-N-acetylmuramidase)
MARLKGLDVSAYQGAIEWDRVPADFVFVIVKVAEGETGRDSMRARNLAGARATGRRVLAYHFTHESADPIRQAENLWEAVGEVLPHRVCIDFETIAKGRTPFAAVASVIRIVDAVAERFGSDPVLYTYPSFAQGLGMALSSAARLSTCPLWMADYRHGENPPDLASPYTPLPWRTWTLWQTSGDKSSRVAGIPSAHVDHNVLNGGESALRALCGLPPATEVPPTIPGVGPIVHPAVPLGREDLDDDEDPPDDPPEGAA